MNKGEVMGLKETITGALNVAKSGQPHKQLDTHAAAQWLQLPAGTIFREDDNVAQMYCPAAQGFEPGYYACILQIKGSKVAVVVGKTVAYLDRQCLPDAFQVFNAAKQSRVRGLLYVRQEGRKTSTVYARI